MPKKINIKKKIHKIPIVSERNYKIIHQISKKKKVTEQSNVEIPIKIMICKP
jgi:hypothetical protein